MRRALFTVVAVIAILVIAAVVLVPLLVDKEQVLALASSTLEEQTGAKLVVNGDADLSIFPTLGLSVSDAAVTLPEKAQPDFKIDALDIGIQFMPLLGGSVEIDTFALDGLDARVELSEPEAPVDTTRMSDAELDAYYAKRREDMRSAGRQAGAEAALAVPLALNVANLSVTNARVELVNPDGTPPTQLIVHALQASGLNIDGRAIPLSLSMEVPGDSPILVDVETQLTVDQETQQANIDGLDIAVNGATPETVSLKGAGTIHLQRQVADLDITLSTGPTQGTGKLRYASFESPQVASTLHFNLLDPAILVLAAPEAAAEATSADAAATGDEPLPLDALRNIDVQADLTVDQARVGAHTINNLNTTLRAVDGEIDLQPLTGELHGGQIKAGLVFNAKHSTPTLRTTGGLNALDLATALAATGSTAKLSGTANFGWQLRSAGKTVNALTAAMQGPIQLDTKDVVLDGTNVEKLLCQAVALSNQESLTSEFPARTKVSALNAKIQLADGKARLLPLTAALPHVGLAGSGEFALLEQDFNLTFKANLSKSMEELDSACRISNKLTGIEWPVKCKGNLADPPAKWCGVDSSQIIKDLTKQKVQKKANKFLRNLLEKK